MSKLEKLLEKIKNNPRSVRFDELDRILTSINAKKKPYVFLSDNRMYCGFMSN